MAGKPCSQGPFPSPALSVTVAAGRPMSPPLPATRARDTSPTAQCGGHSSSLAGAAAPVPEAGVSRSSVGTLHFRSSHVALGASRARLAGRAVVLVRLRVVATRSLWNPARLSRRPISSWSRDVPSHEQNQIVAMLRGGCEINTKISAPPSTQHPCYSGIDA
jgi:hypothetical protein